jgi:hypothetical protein
MLLAAAAACALLTSQEILRVQGEPVLEQKPTASEQGDLKISQCFFALKTFPRSVSLQVTRGPGVRALWQRSFHERGEKEEKEPPPELVEDLGDEAFWSGDPRLGGLFVLRGQAMLRLAVGGAEGKPEKLRKLKALARKALRRL